MVSQKSWWDLMSSLEGPWSTISHKFHGALSKVLIWRSWPRSCSGSCENLGGILFKVVAWSCTGPCEKCGYPEYYPVEIHYKGGCMKILNMTCLYDSSCRMLLQEVLVHRSWRICSLAGLSMMILQYFLRCLLRMKLLIKILQKTLRRSCRGPGTIRYNRSFHEDLADAVH